MAFMDWSDEMSVGVAKIDSQHKHLLELVNSLHDAMSQGKGRELLGATLTELVEYTVTHFATEEGLMTTHGYGDYDAHKAIHDDLTAKASELKAKADAGKVVISIEVMDFLRDWLKNHIMKTDKSYSSFFAEKGVS